MIILNMKSTFLTHQVISCSSVSIQTRLNMIFSAKWYFKSLGLRQMVFKSPRWKMDSTFWMTLLVK